MLAKGKLRELEKCGCWRHRSRIHVVNEVRHEAGDAENAEFSASRRPQRLLRELCEEFPRLRRATLVDKASHWCAGAPVQVSPAFFWMSGSPTSGGRRVMPVPPGRRGSRRSWVGRRRAWPAVVAQRWSAEARVSRVRRSWPARMRSASSRFRGRQASPSALPAGPAKTSQFLGFSDRVRASSAAGRSRSHSRPRAAGR